MTARVTGEIVAGTRGSVLALTQTDIVCEALRRVAPDARVHIERIKTTGDVAADIPLSKLGRGVFVTEIETALREGRIDFAVHSAKDLPSTLATDLVLAAFLPRADPRDVVVSRAGRLRDLPAGARVATSSPRRACQLRAMRPDLECVSVRGNVDTRLRKLASGSFDALVLAAAGLIRLGRETEITEWLDVDAMVPSVGQGALAIEARADDALLIEMLGALDDRACRVAVTAERAFLAELGAGCRAAAGAHATVSDRGQLHITALIGNESGERMMFELDGNAADAERIGAHLAREMLAAGAARFLARADSPLAGKRVAVTRAREQATELVALLHARGAECVVCPAIAIEPTTNTRELDDALRGLSSASWLVFTSANAVRVVAGRLGVVHLTVPATVRLAALGAATADVLERLIRPADYSAPEANAESLALHLPDVDGRTVIFPHGDIARGTLARRLEERGARVRRVVAYRTVAGTGVSDLAERAASGDLDVVTFASPSAVSFTAGALRKSLARAPRRPLFVGIGETTASAIRDAGFAVAGVAHSQSVGGLVECLERVIGARSQVSEPLPRCP